MKILTLILHSIWDPYFLYEISILEAFLIDQGYQYFHLYFKPVYAYLRSNDLKSFYSFNFLYPYLKECLLMERFTCHFACRFILQDFQLFQLVVDIKFFSLRQTEYQTSLDFAMSHQIISLYFRL